MDDLFNIPENAIQAYEKWSFLTVTVHDLQGTLGPYLSPERYFHHTPICAAVKNSEHGHKCFDFSFTRLRQEIDRFPEGRTQVCHADLVEWVVPSFRENGLDWILFAGQRQPGKLLNFIQDPVGPPRPSPWPKGTVWPKRVDEEQSTVFLEGLRQLNARLIMWQNQMAATQTKRRHRTWASDVTQRRTAIRHFIQQRHTAPIRLENLAKLLHLSPSRAAHVVRDICGATFHELLTEARLRTAARLLRDTNQSIIEVALQSGFGDASHFHRSFRKALKTSPRKYRQNAREMLEKQNE